MFNENIFRNMSNIIDKIQLSGVTYDIGGSGGITSGEVQTMIDENISGKTDNTTFTAYTATTDTTLGGKVDTTAIVTAITSSSTDAQVPSAKCVYDQVGGLKLVKLTQSAYDALDPNYDSNTLYVING